jgi:CHAT domain-containing protein
VLPALVVEANVTHVSRRQLNGSVIALRQAAALNDGRGWKKAVDDLAAVIPPAVRARLTSASKIIVMPHDVLWRVPFEALPSGGRLLGDHASISLAGSLGSLIHSSSIPIASSDRRTLAVGAPELTPDRTARFKHVAPGWALRVREPADVELEAVSATYDARAVTVLSGTAATEAAVRAHLRASLLHVAAPFRINAASPLFSSILLSSPAVPVPPAGAAAPERTAGAPTTGASPASATSMALENSAARRNATDDGALELREVMNLGLNARVAIFSDGAATSMRDGASAADVLQWGWLAAGVPTLLVARWAAPPAAGAQLLSEFHKRIQGGVDPAAALRAAQLAVRSRPETAAPIHWAGWMLLGSR